MWITIHENRLFTESLHDEPSPLTTPSMRSVLGSSLFLTRATLQKKMLTSSKTSGSVSCSHAYFSGSLIVNASTLKLGNCPTA